MKRLISVTLAIFCCLCLAIATDRRAYGYVDPGTGYMAIQSIAAGLAAAAYYMRRRIAALFGRGKAKAETVILPTAKQEDSNRNVA